MIALEIDALRDAGYGEPLGAELDKAVDLCEVDIDRSVRGVEAGELHVKG